MQKRLISLLVYDGKYVSPYVCGEMDEEIIDANK